MFPIEKDTKGFLLATDGLWDELGNERVLDIYKAGIQKGNFLQQLLLNALETAGKRNGLSLGEIQ